MGRNKILIVEDNIITAKHISSALKKFGYEITDLANSLESATKSIIREIPDLVILDINLGREVDGIQIAEVLEREYGIGFIFLTSYNDEETINRIIKLNPLGYIIKPFNPIDLNAVVELALFKLKTRNNITEQPSQNKGEVASLEAMDEYLFVKNGRQIDRIPIKDIDFIQADGRYTFIHLSGVKKISNTPLKSLLEKLSTAHFVKTHKSFIVNLAKVDTIALNHLFIGDIEIPISKNYRGDLLSGLDIV